MKTKDNQANSDSIDAFFAQNPLIREALPPPSALPLPVTLSSGKPGVTICFRETSDFIDQLGTPLFDIKYGHLKTGKVWVVKLMLVVARKSDVDVCSLVEMDLDFHHPTLGVELFNAFAANGEIIVRFYGDEWTSKRQVSLFAMPQMAAYFTQIGEYLKSAPRWTFEEFSNAHEVLRLKYGLKQTWSDVIPEQMNQFITTGRLESLGLSSPKKNKRKTKKESLDDRHKRHQEYMKRQLTVLLPIAQQGFKEKGRGAVMVKLKKQPKHGERIQLSYLSLDEICGEEWDMPTGQVESYSPERQLVVMIDDDDRVSSYRLGN